MMEVAAMLATRIFNTPLVIEPAKAAVILGALSERLGIVSHPSIDGAQLANRGLKEDHHKKGSFEIAGRVAVIKVHGTLVHRSSYLDALSGLTGYEDLSENFHAAMDDPQVDAIFMDIDSPGGEAAGCFDLVDSMMTRVNEKPIHAHINEFSASGAYAITTAADHVSIARTGFAGSIGALVIHQEYTKYLEKEGIKATIIRAGEQKARVNPYEELTEDDRDNLQEALDRLRDVFISTVARNRGVSEDIIRGTEAAMFGADEALKLNLVDAIMSAEEAATHLVNSLG